LPNSIGKLEVKLVVNRAWHFSGGTSMECGRQELGGVTELSENSFVFNHGRFDLSGPADEGYLVPTVRTNMSDLNNRQLGTGTVVFEL
jgi:hypothetical protein